MNQTAIKTLKEVMETSNLSLRKLSQILDLNYNMMLKMGKKPVPNEIFNPDLINWTEVETYITNKGKDWTTIDWDEIKNETSEKVTVDVRTKYPVGTDLTIRGTTNVHMVTFVTDKQIVLLDVVEDNLRLFNHSTFLHQTPRLVTNENLI